MRSFWLTWQEAFILANDAGGRVFAPMRPEADFLAERRGRRLTFCQRGRRWTFWPERLEERKGLEGIRRRERFRVTSTLLGGGGVPVSSSPGRGMGGGGPFMRTATPCRRRGVIIQDSGRSRHFRITTKSDMECRDRLPPGMYRVAPNSRPSERRRIGMHA
jgi:hypothetical protein